MYQLEASEYTKLKGEDSDQSDKLMKQIPLLVHQIMKKCSLSCSNEINTVLVDFVALDLQLLMVMDLTSCYLALSQIYSSFKNVCYEHFETAEQCYEAKTTGIYVFKKHGNYYRYINE